MSLVTKQKNSSVSKYNAQKHSILRDSPTEYESVDLSVLYTELVDDLNPKGKMQEMLVEVIALNTIKLARIVKSESEYIKMLLSPYIKGELDVELFKKAHYEYEPKIDFTDKHFKLFSRYQTAIENRIYKALSALKILQNEQS